MGLLWGAATAEAGSEAGDGTHRKSHRGRNKGMRGLISQQKFFLWSYFCGTSDSKAGSPFLSTAATIVQQGDREQEGVQSLGKPLVII